MKHADTPAATILVVEDRKELRDVLRRTLHENGFAVQTVGDGAAALAAIAEHRPDLVVLDVGLPGRSGLEVVRALRADGSRTPVLMLTAHNEVPDRIAGFAAGADDYLGKPFDYGELLARVHALLRRSRTEANVIRFADLVLDPVSRQLTRGGRAVPLTGREFALIEFFLRHAGRPVTRDEISEQVWGVPFDPENNVIDVYISYLRTKLDAAGERPLLQTVRRVGYVLRDGTDAPVGK